MVPFSLETSLGDQSCAIRSGAFKGCCSLLLSVDELMSLFEDPPIEGWNGLAHVFG